MCRSDQVGDSRSRAFYSHSPQPQLGFPTDRLSLATLTVSLHLSISLLLSHYTTHSLTEPPIPPTVHHSRHTPSRPSCAAVSSIGKW